VLYNRFLDGGTGDFQDRVGENVSALLSGKPRYRWILCARLTNEASRVWGSSNPQGDEAGTRRPLITFIVGSETRRGAREGKKETLYGYS
jgi:hypothetical protein